MKIFRQFHAPSQWIFSCFQRKYLQINKGFSCLIPWILFDVFVVPFASLDYFLFVSIVLLIAAQNVANTCCVLGESCCATFFFLASFCVFAIFLQNKINRIRNQPGCFGQFLFFFFFVSPELPLNNHQFHLKKNLRRKQKHQKEWNDKCTFFWTFWWILQTISIEIENEIWCNQRSEWFE